MRESDDSATECADDSVNFLETSWTKRLKYVFQKSEDGRYTKIEHIPAVVFWSSVVGFVIGGRYGSTAAAIHHVEATQLAVFDSKLDAHRVYHKNMVVGLLRMGSKWGWRMGLFAGTYSLFVVMADELQQKENAFSYVAAGALTGGLYNVFSGYRSVFVGTILGTAFSVPCAALMGAVNLALPTAWRDAVKTMETEKANKLKEKENMDWEKRAEKLGEVVRAFKSQVEIADELNTAYAGADHVCTGEEKSHHQERLQS